MRYDRTVHLDTDFATTVGLVREALAGQGFGILTEIDVTATLKAKLDHDMEDYVRKTGPFIDHGATTTSMVVSAAASGSGRTVARSDSAFGSS